MSCITYAVINEGVRKLVEYPMRSATNAASADALQTVLTTVPLGDRRQQEVEDDNGFTYFYLSNGRHLVGCACRRAGGGNAPFAHNVLSDVRAFLHDVIALAPPDTATVLTEEKLDEMRGLLKARLEASTDAKLTEVNAAIARARQQVEANIEAALERGAAVTRMEQNSAQLAQSATDLDRKTKEMNWMFLGQRIKTLLMFVGAVVAIVLVLVIAVCGADLSGCSTDDSKKQQQQVATTSAPANPFAPPPTMIVNGVH